MESETTDRYNWTSKAEQFIIFIDPKNTAADKMESNR